MRKIVFFNVIIILFFSFMTMQADSLVLEDITLNLNSNQIGVTFINNYKMLIHLDKEELTLNKKNGRLVVNNNKYETFIYKNILISINNNQIIVNYNNKNLCILDNDVSIKCNYIYLINDNKLKDITNDTELIIYNFDIREETILRNYSRWIDSLELKKNYYTTIIWDGSQYQTTRIPKKKYQLYG